MFGFTPASEKRHPSSVALIAYPKDFEESCKYKSPCHFSALPEHGLTEKYAPAGGRDVMYIFLYGPPNL